MERSGSGGGAVGDGVPRSSSARMVNVAADNQGRKKGASGGGLSSTIKSARRASPLGNNARLQAKH